MMNRRSVVAPSRAPIRPALYTMFEPRHRVIMALWSYQVMMSRLGGEALRRRTCGTCGTDRLHSVWADGESYHCFHCIIVGRHPVVRLDDEPPLIRSAVRRCDLCGLPSAHLLWPAALGEPCATCLYLFRRPAPFSAEAPSLPEPKKPLRRTAFEAFSALFF